MVVIALIGLISSLAAYGMVPKTIHDLPEEVKRQIIYCSHLKDSIAFTSTCKTFHALPLHFETLRIIAKNKMETNTPSADFFLYTGFAIGSTGFFLPYNSIVLCGIVFSGIGTLAMGLKEEQHNKHQYTFSKHIKLIADKLSNKKITTDILNINCFEATEAQPLLNAARNGTTQKVIINLYTQKKTIAEKVLHPQQLLDICPPLKENIYLTALEIIQQEVHGWGETIDTQRFSEGLQHNTKLKTLKLGSISLSPDLLDTIFKHPLEELTLTTCHTSKKYNFTALSENTTLKKLTITYFTNHDTGIDLSVLPYITAFITHNTKLENFTLKSISLSNDARASLQTQAHSLKQCMISNQ